MTDNIKNGMKDSMKDDMKDSMKDSMKDNMRDSKKDCIKDRNAKKQLMVRRIRRLLEEKPSCLLYIFLWVCLFL